MNKTSGLSTRKPWAKPLGIHNWRFDEYQLIKVNMKIIETQIPQVKIIEPKLFEDHRGSFYESFHQNRYQELAGIQDAFVQDNTSRSKQGVLRGLHYQTKHPQGKLVSVLEGDI